MVFDPLEYWFVAACSVSVELRRYTVVKLMLAV